MTNEVKDLSVRLKQKESQIKLMSMMSRGRLQSTAAESQVLFSSDTESDHPRVSTVDVETAEKAARKLQKVRVWKRMVKL